jgi:hypothetical protein
MTTRETHSIDCDEKSPEEAKELIRKLAPTADDEMVEKIFCAFRLWIHRRQTKSSAATKSENGNKR